MEGGMEVGEEGEVSAKKKEKKNTPKKPPVEYNDVNNFRIATQKQNKKKKQKERPSCPTRMLKSMLHKKR